MPAPPARPRQVTWSGAIICLGSVFVLLSAWQVVLGVGSLETREGVEEFLAVAPGDGLGLDVPAALEVLRITAMAAAALAVAAAILGWQVLQKSRSARVVLSVMAVPLFLTGTVTGGLVSAAVVASIITLWLSPAREWFAGRPLPDPPARTRPDARPDAAASQRPTWPPPLPQEPGRHGPGHHEPGQQQGQEQPGPADRRLEQQAGTTARTPRPPALVVACLVSWSLCGLTLLFAAGGAIVMWTSPDLVVEALQQQDPAALEQGLSVRDLQVGTTVILGVLGVWCLGASVAAAFALRGSVAGRVALLVCAAVAAALTLLSVLGSLAFVVPLAGCLVVVALLVRPEVRAWP